MTEHVFVVHENCHAQSCMICDGGLALCAVCGGLEGSLPSECPGAQMDEQTIDRVYRGEIDYRNGAWVAAISPASPASIRQTREDSNHA